MNYTVIDLSPAYELRDAYNEGYIAGSKGLCYLCHNCSQPKHAKTPTYYNVRTAVRFLFWTAVVTVFSAVGIAAIWILWAVS